MTVEQVYHRADLEWQCHSNLRAKYATFIYYWHERYERVYGIEYREKTTSGFLNNNLEH